MYIKERAGTKVLIRGKEVEEPMKYVFQILDSFSFA